MAIALIVLVLVIIGYRHPLLYSYGCLKKKKRRNTRQVELWRKAALSNWLKLGDNWSSHTIWADVANSLNRSKLTFTVVHCCTLCIYLLSTLPLPTMSSEKTSMRDVTANWQIDIPQQCLLLLNWQKNTKVSLVVSQYCFECTLYTFNATVDLMTPPEQTK